MAKNRPFHWKDGLLVELERPENWFQWSNNVIVIPDRYPKAIYHFLVLPRQDIPSIFELTRYDLSLLNEMYSMALHIIDEKGRRRNEFRIGYHAEPSLLQLHLHVISTDFHSPTLKTPRHYNSFNTKLFIPHQELVRRIMADGRIHKMSAREVNTLRQTPLRCHRCSQKSRNMDDHKTHLITHLRWQ